MKEQVLHLDPHDDYIAARDKMGWAQTTRVLLVWPPGGEVLRRRIDLLMLQRHARRLGAHLALVTRDPVVRENAREVGLPAFGSVDDSRRLTWTNRTGKLRPEKPGPVLDRTALRPAPRLNAPAWPKPAVWAARSLVFIAGVAGLAALAMAVVPGARVAVVPARQPVQASVQIIADPLAVAAAGLADGPVSAAGTTAATIPARVVRVEVEASGQTDTTGLSEVPSQPAGGTVVFSSLDGTVTIIPAGTGLRTSTGNPVRFKTIQPVTLEPRLGASVSVGIQAVDLGPVGNVAAGQINAIDGPLGLQLAVTNPGPASGGAVAQRPSVTADDQARLYDQLLAQLQSEAVSAVESQAAQGEFAVDSSVLLAEEVARTYNQSVGEQANNVQLSLRLAFTGLAVNEAQVRGVAAAALAEAVPFRRQLVPESAQFVRVADTTQFADGRVSFRVDASGVAVPVIDPELVRELVKGQTVASAQQRLAIALPLDGRPQIELEPDWYPRVPWMPFRITVLVEGG
ncbi:MAG: baseplate J/gp47 family protein [Anaerolineales bacterium]